MIEIEDAVKVVDFVLQNAREEPIGADANLFAVNVAPLYDHHHCALDVFANIAGDTQAALRADLFAARLDNFRVDENLQTVLELGHQHAQRLSHLGRGKANPIGGSHGFDHIINQPLDAGIKTSDPLGFLAEDGIFNGNDFSERHSCCSLGG